jgi:hypothetical protein
VTLPPFVYYWAANLIKDLTKSLLNCSSLKVLPVSLLCVVTVQNGILLSQKSNACLR